MYIHYWLQPRGRVSIGDFTLLCTEIFTTIHFSPVSCDDGVMLMISNQPWSCIFFLDFVFPHSVEIPQILRIVVCFHHVITTLLQIVLIKTI